MSDPERRALAVRLFGTGKKGEPPGPFDAGWVVAHLAGSRTTLQRWRSSGIPPDRIDDVLAAVRDAVPGTTKEPPRPEWAERLEAKVDSILERQSVVGETYARQVIEALASPELMEWQARIAARLAELPPQDDATPGDSGEVPGAGSSGRRALEPS